MLPANKLKLDDELEIQAQIQFDISMECTRLNTKALEAENELKTMEAELFVKFKDSGEKMTADEIKAQVRVHRERAKAWEKYQAAREAHEQWAGLLQAWTTKGYKLADLGGLYAADYFSMTSISGNRAVNPVEEHSRSAIRRATERADSTPRRRAE